MLALNLATNVCGYTLLNVIMSLVWVLWLSLKEAVNCNSLTGDGLKCSFVPHTWLGHLMIIWSAQLNPTSPLLWVSKSQRKRWPKQTVFMPPDPGFWYLSLRAGLLLETTSPDGLRTFLVPQLSYFIRQLWAKCVHALLPRWPLN